jgi:Lrp/AsnC family transcriptional regulator
MTRLAPVSRHIALYVALNNEIGRRFVNVRTTQHTPTWFERFADAVAKIDEVVEFYRMSGDVAPTASR